MMCFCFSGSVSSHSGGSSTIKEAGEITLNDGQSNQQITTGKITIYTSFKMSLYY